MVLGVDWGINQPNNEGNANACGNLVRQPLILWYVGFNDWFFHD
jgi:hypothetical protein